VSSHASLVSLKDLRPSERRFVMAMQQLGYERIESLQVRSGELVLEPWPATIRCVKFGNATANQPVGRSEESKLKKQIAELFEQVRTTDTGMIRVLEVRGGLPFSMEILKMPR